MKAENVYFLEFWKTIVWSANQRAANTGTLATLQFCHLSDTPLCMKGHVICMDPVASYKTNIQSLLHQMHGESVFFTHSPLGESKHRYIHGSCLSTKIVLIFTYNKLLQTNLSNNLMAQKAEEEHNLFFFNAPCAWEMSKCCVILQYHRRHSLDLERKGCNSEGEEHFTMDKVLLFTESRCWPI